jgi:hypothetical protein
MDYPELDPDESIILQSRNVKFKSISFDVVLTGKRIHLTGNKNKIIPSHDIILATLRNVETGENAIRDHFLILSLITDAGEKHQVVLTFAKQAGAERKRECHEWAKKLNYLIPPSTPVIAPFTGPAVDKEQATKREVPRPPQEAAISTHPARKKREIISLNRPVIEKSPGNSKSRATPSHLFPPIFCSGCGNRQARHHPHPAPQLRDSPDREGIRHSDDPGAVGPLRCLDHHDLHARRDEEQARRHQPGGCAGGGTRIALARPRIL